MTQIQNTDLHQVMSLLGKQDTEFHLRAKEKKVDGVKAMTLYVKDPNAHSFNIFAGRRPQKFQAAREFLKSSLVNAGLEQACAESLLNSATVQSKTKGKTIQLGRFTTQVESLQNQYLDLLANQTYQHTLLGEVGDVNGRRRKITCINQSIEDHNFTQATALLADLKKEVESAQNIKQKLSELEERRPKHKELVKARVPYTHSRENLIRRIEGEIKNGNFENASKSLKELDKEIQRGKDFQQCRGKLDGLRRMHDDLSERLKPDPLLEKRKKLIFDIGKLIENGYFADTTKPMRKLKKLLDLDNRRAQHQYLIKNLKDDSFSKDREELIERIETNMLNDKFEATGESLENLDFEILEGQKKWNRQLLKTRQEKHQKLSRDYGGRRDAQIKQITVCINNGEFKSVRRGLNTLDQLIKNDEIRQPHIARLDKLREQHDKLGAFDRLGKVPGFQQREEIIADVERQIIESYSESKRTFNEINKALPQLEESVKAAQEKQPYRETLATLRFQHLGLGKIGKWKERAQIYNKMQRNVHDREFDHFDDQQSKFEELHQEDTAIAKQQGKTLVGSYDNVIRDALGPSNEQSERMSSKDAQVKYTRLAVDVSTLAFNKANFLTVAKLTGLKEGLAKRPDLEKSAHGALLLRRVEQLAENRALLATLNSIEAPPEGSPICDVIRATIGINPQKKVTARHARKAALAALLGELRQSDVGSCFGTAVAISVHDDQPQRFLSNIKEMIETGYLSQQYVKDGKRPARVSAQTGLSEKDYGNQMITLELDASISNGHERVRRAFSDWWVNHPNPAILRGMAAVDIRDEDLATAAADYLPNPTEDEVYLPQSEVIEQALRNKHHLNSGHISIHRALVQTEAQVRYLERAYGALFKGVRQSNELPAGRLQAAYKELQVAKEQSLVLSNQFKSFKKQWTLYERDIQWLKEHTIGYQNIPLSRSFEYSISAFAETGSETQLRQEIVGTINMRLSRNLRNWLTNKLPADQQLIEAQNAFERHTSRPFTTAFTGNIGKVTKNLTLAYDPNIQAYNASKGTMTKGGFRLVNTHGKESPNEWTTIDSEQAYDEMVMEIVNLTLDEVFKAATDESLRNHTSYIRSAVCQWAETARTEKEEDKTSRTTGWEFKSGNWGSNVMGNYYNDKIVQLKQKCESGQDIMQLIMDAHKRYGNKLSADDEHIINSIGGRPGHQFRFKMPLTEYSKQFFEAARKSPNLPPTEVAKQINLPDKTIIVYGDSNHRNGDDRTLYGLMYVDGKFQTVRGTNDGKWKYDDKNIQGEWEILLNPAA